MRSIILDTETTGLLKVAAAPLSQQPYIIDVGAVVVDGDTVEREYSQLVKPPINLPASITRITGISNTMLEGAPSFADVAGTVQQLFKGVDVFIAHNAYFDLTMLKNEFDRLGLTFQAPKSIVCTVEEFTPFFGYPPKLTELYERVLGVPLFEQHRALADARDLWAIYKTVLEQYRD